MATGANSFTPEEFLAKLETDELDSPLTLTGMVKTGEEGSTELMFVVGTKCTTWTSVPVDIIEKIDVLGTVPCDDHAHHRVTLTFKAPQSPEAAAYAGLLRARPQSGSRRRVVHKPKAGGSTDFLSGAPCSEIEIDAAGTVWELVDYVTFDDGSCICTYQH
jgi:hypothetical protein